MAATKRGKTGPHPRSGAAPRTEHVQVLLSPDELRHLDSARGDWTRSAFLRRLIVENIVQPRQRRAA